MANPKSATVMGIGAVPLVKGKLTPEQADQLAATFRPSWDLDEVLFSPDATLSDADMRALEASAANGQVGLQNGHSSQPHSPPPRVPVSEPEDSVIIDRSITADQLAGNSPSHQAPAPVVALHDASRAPLNQTLPLNQTAPLNQPAPLNRTVPLGDGGIVLAQRAPAPMQVAQSSVVTDRPPPMAVAQPRRMTADDDDVAPKKSKVGLFVGLGIAAAAILGIGVAVAMSGGEKTPSAATDSTATATTQKEKAIPPPPPATAAATTATPATATTTAAAPTTPPPPTQTAKQEPAAAAPRPRNPSGGGGGGAPPAPRPPPPKSGGNIVRDVPF